MLYSFFSLRLSLRIKTLYILMWAACDKPSGRTHEGNIYNPCLYNHRVRQTCSTGLNNLPKNFYAFLIAINSSSLCKVCRKKRVSMIYGILLIALFACAAYTSARRIGFQDLSFSPMIIGVILGMLCASSLPQQSARDVGPRHPVLL